MMTDKEADQVRAVVWSLPVDATESILVRLPAIDLVCYKLVCKPWLSLISSPGFISAHLNFNKSNPSGHSLLFHDSSSCPDFYLPGPFRSAVYYLSMDVTVVGSVNGLICTTVYSTLECPMAGEVIWILNPVTGHARKLPPLPKCPFRSHNSFVFWWDGEYKLVNIVSKPDNETVASLWVSSSPETWTEIHVGFTSPFYHSHKFGSGCDIVVGDFAYWVMFNNSMYVPGPMDMLGSSGPEPGDLFVLSLDLKTLSFKAVPFPLHFMTPKSLASDHLWFGDNSFLFVANWKGKFALVEKDVNAVLGVTKMYNVFTMDGDLVWHIESAFDLDFSFERCIANINGKLVLSICHCSPYNGITLYDIETGEDELIIESSERDPCVTSAHAFVGSFVSIEGFKPIGGYDSRDYAVLLQVSWPYASAIGICGNANNGPYVLEWDRANYR